ncbi:MAG TPA: FUSC family protein [Mycobacterium sp.]|nr:FUSC family protein [Mycobacterium sp.]
MASSLLTRSADSALAAVQRLRAVLWPITQASVAAGLAWFLAHDVLAHRQPFFAPISATVCLSASNVLRGQRAVQMIIGVALGIFLGAAVQALVGTGAIAIAVAVLIALSVAVLIGRGFIAQGLMFVNQTAVSAILVLVFARSGGVVVERLFDALIGGGLAVVFGILLFPANPLTLLRSARAGVLAALHDILVQVADVIGDRTSAGADWPLSVVDRLQQQLAGLTQARTTARMVVRAAPRRWAARDIARDADQQAAQLALLASSVLHLARAAPNVNGWLPHPMHAAIAELAAGVALADADPTAAAEHAAAARHHVLHAATRNRTAGVLVGVIQSCVDDLQRVIDLGQVRSRRRGIP